MSGGVAPARVSRGQPLLVLIMIVVGWCAMRVLLWQPPFDTTQSRDLPALAVRSAGVGVPQRGPDPAKFAKAPSLQPASVVAPTLPAAHALAAEGREWSAVSVPPLGHRPMQPSGPSQPLEGAFAQSEQPGKAAAYFPAGDRDRVPPFDGKASPRGVAASPTSSNRWTGDSWLLLRSGSRGPIAAAEPSYGRSQAGAVLRYRLVPSSGHRPVAYVRATRALAGPREGEIAAGLAARPLAALPVRIAGELRVSEGSNGRELRAAGFAVTELPPLKLAHGMLAEAYAQGGYVGGRFATPFVDGQVRLDGPVARLGPDAEMRAGGGLWGGVQKHAGRLDVGPSAAFDFPLGEARTRVAFDYRVRVAGRAAPKSGPALTISAGF